MAVQKLADALASGQPDVADTDVVNRIGQPWLRGETLEQNFRSGDKLGFSLGQVGCTRRETEYLSPRADPSGDPDG